MYLVCVIGGLIIGIITGVVITVFISRKHPIGDLVIDRSDPTEPPYLFLELYKNVGDFSTEKYVTLQVCNRNYISQK